MVQVLSARLRKLRPAEECGGTSEVVLCYGLFVVSCSQIQKKRTKLFGTLFVEGVPSGGRQFCFPSRFETKRVGNCGIASRSIQSEPAIPIVMLFLKFLSF